MVRLISETGAIEASDLMAYAAEIGLDKVSVGY
jgi:hypothetical protein